MVDTKPDYVWLQEAAENPDWKYANLRALKYLTKMSEEYHVMSKALHMLENSESDRRVVCRVSGDSGSIVRTIAAVLHAKGFDVCIALIDCHSKAIMDSYLNCDWKIRLPIYTIREEIPPSEKPRLILFDDFCESDGNEHIPGADLSTLMTFLKNDRVLFVQRPAEWDQKSLEIVQEFIRMKQE
jgi:hypothetical protein